MPSYFLILTMLDELRIILPMSQEQWFTLGTGESAPKEFLNSLNWVLVDSIIYNYQSSSGSVEDLFN